MYMHAIIYCSCFSKEKMKAKRKMLNTYIIHTYVIRIVQKVLFRKKRKTHSLVAVIETMLCTMHL